MAGQLGPVWRCGVRGGWAWPSHLFSDIEVYRKKSVDILGDCQAPENRRGRRPPGPGGAGVIGQKVGTDGAKKVRVDLRALFCRGRNGKKRTPGISAGSSLAAHGHPARGGPPKRPGRASDFHNSAYVRACQGPALKKAQRQGQGRASTASAPTLRAQPAGLEPCPQPLQWARAGMTGAKSNFKEVRVYVLLSAMRGGRLLRKT